MKLFIRPESHVDVNAISEVTVTAFRKLEISSHTEQFIIAALRAAEALAVSLVAEMDGRVIGHIAFSLVTISDGARDWYGLGPISVLPECQGQGVGRALIEDGLARLKEIEAQGCCLVGEPELYRKFGFRNADSIKLKGVPPEYFLALAFGGEMPEGSVTYHEGFNAVSWPEEHDS